MRRPDARRVLAWLAVVMALGGAVVAARRAGHGGGLAVAVATLSADMIVTYRETVALTLNQFQDQGLVKLGRRGVRVLVPTRLEAVAEG